MTEREHNERPWGSYTVLEDAKILILFDGPPNGEASTRGRLTS